MKDKDTLRDVRADKRPDPLAMVSNSMVRNIRQPKEISCFEFIPDTDKPWFMKITCESGSPIIKFNTEAYPDCIPSDFAKAVVELLSKDGYIPKCLEENDEPLKGVYGSDEEIKQLKS